MPARILLVEDHEDTADLMVRVLRMSGYEVCLAKDVREALAAANSQSFDLALCDIELPDGDGCDLMGQLHELHDLDGIAVTGYADLEMRERISRARFMKYLTKPTTFDQLQAAIDECLAKRLQADVRAEQDHQPVA